MTFVEYKKFSQDNPDFFVYMLLIAIQVEFFRRVNDLEFTDDEFEIVCDFIYHLHTDSAPEQLAKIICDGLFNESITVADIKNGEAEDWVFKQF